ncbi:hypothetical protein Pelo_5798 [Pelomyxa schiedti]|nr:hypothetical protein Pelo_5798 [Pelomyxa schiedti]
MCAGPSLVRQLWDMVALTTHKFVVVVTEHGTPRTGTEWGCVSEYRSVAFGVSGLTLGVVGDVTSNCCRREDVTVDGRHLRFNSIITDVVTGKACKVPFAIQNCVANRKWLVACGCSDSSFVVAKVGQLPLEIPPIRLSHHIYWMGFNSSNPEEEAVVVETLEYGDYGIAVLIQLVNMALTFEMKSMEIVSSTPVSFLRDHPSRFLESPLLCMRRENGTNVFVVPFSFSSGNEILLVEETTGTATCVSKARMSSLSQQDDRVFLVSFSIPNTPDTCCAQFWDCNNTSKPLRVVQQRGVYEWIAAGGFFFKVLGTCLDVEEGTSGTHVLSLKFPPNDYIRIERLLSHERCGQRSPARTLCGRNASLPCQLWELCTFTPRKFVMVLSACDGTDTSHYFTFTFAVSPLVLSTVGEVTGNCRPIAMLDERHCFDRRRSTITDLETGQGANFLWTMIIGKCLANNKWLIAAGHANLCGPSTGSAFVVMKVGEISLKAPLIRLSVEGISWIGFNSLDPEEQAVVVGLRDGYQPVFVIQVLDLRTTLETKQPAIVSSTRVKTHIGRPRSVDCVICMRKENGTNVIVFVSSFATGSRVLVAEETTGKCACVSKEASPLLSQQDSRIFLISYNTVIFCAEFWDCNNTAKPLRTVMKRDLCQWISDSGFSFKVSKLSGPEEGIRRITVSDAIPEGQVRCGHESPAHPLCRNPSLARQLWDITTTPRRYAVVSTLHTFDFGETMRPGGMTRVGGPAPTQQQQQQQQPQHYHGVAGVPRAAPPAVAPAATSSSVMDWRRRVDAECKRLVSAYVDVLDALPIRSAYGPELPPCGPPPPAPSSSSSSSAATTSAASGDATTTTTTSTGDAMDSQQATVSSVVPPTSSSVVDVDADEDPDVQVIEEPRGPPSASSTQAPLAPPSTASMSQSLSLSPGGAASSSLDPPSSASSSSLMDYASIRAAAQNELLPSGADVATARDALQLHRAASSIATASQSLLRVVFELRHAALMRDYGALAASNEAARREFEKARGGALGGLAALRCDVGDALRVLEDAYYHDVL